MLKDKLRSLRIKKNLKQKDMANVLRMSRTGYASWEQGLAEPNAEDLRKLCVFYDITADELLEIDFYKDLIKKENEF